MGYSHRWLDGQAVKWPVGKVVCVGRNYADHARELGNAVPTEPILFIKPASAIVTMEQGFRIPEQHGACHIETEMALLIGQPLTCASEDDCVAAIAGVGIGFDLTLRDVQNQLKQLGQPWEKAKAFDGSCPLSVFSSVEGVEWGQVHLRLQRNGMLQQDGCSDAMITPVPALLAFISQWFTLQPGDVVLTGTPAGVGPLTAGDQLQAELATDSRTLLAISSQVLS